MSEHHPHLDAAQFEHTLTKKAGPLPVWAWGLGIGAVLVVFLWLHNRNSADTAPTTAYDDGSTLDGLDSRLQDSDAYQSGFAAGAGSGGGSGDGDNGDDGSDGGGDPTDTNPDGTASDTHKGGKGKGNNASWLRRASAALTARGVANPLRVSRVLNRYLSGQAPRNKSERRIVNQAIKATGLPPNVPQHVSTNTHTQQPQAQAHHDHVVQPHVSNAGHTGPPTKPPHHHAAGVR